MLIHLQELADETGIGALRLFGYTSFRAVCAAFTAFVLMMVVMPRLIRWLQRKKFGESGAKGDGAEVVDAMREQKAGTPTMGGLGLVGCVLVTALLWCDPGEPQTLILCLSMLGFAVLGYLDDRTKVFKGAHGIPKRVKLVLQLLVGLGCGLAAWSIDQGIVIEQISPTQRVEGGPWLWEVDASSAVQHHVLLPLLPADAALYIGVGLIVWTLFVTTACANAVNFTDGMDGLASGTMLIAALAFMVIAYLASHFVAAHYLGIFHVPGAQEVAVFCAAIVGGCLGFLWFNAPPARVFMGDTGSQALGGTLAMISILAKQEFMILVVGFVFFVEGLSVFLQIAVFRATGGKRLFRCAPIHHHFQYLGWPETRIVLRFWVVAATTALLALASLKLR